MSLPRLKSSICGRTPQERYDASLGATVCFSKLELTLHGSPVLFLAADVVVLPLYTRH
jgi:hypothetical protein